MELRRLLDRRPKPIGWLGGSKYDLSAFPDDVKDRLGSALWEAQLGMTPYIAKPLKGFGDASVIEAIDDFDGDTYRAVYTVRFAGVIYVLHVFQKKSHSGISMPRRDIALVRERLSQARKEYLLWRESQQRPARFQ